MSTGTQSTTPRVSSNQDQELVKGLGLTSATTLVMGSMIGSGVFIVAADIARRRGQTYLDNVMRLTATLQ